MPSPDQIISIARMFLYVREAQSLGQNRGLRVEAIQHWAGGVAGDSWCAEWVWMVLDLAYAGQPPYSRIGSCESLRSLAETSGWLRDTPTVGDLFLYLDATGRAHHVGFVTGLTPLTGVAGNTSADGTSANGDRVAEHAITAKTFIHYQV